MLPLPCIYLWHNWPTDVARCQTAKSEALSLLRRWRQWRGWAQTIFHGCHSCFRKWSERSEVTVADDNTCDGHIQIVNRRTSWLLDIQLTSYLWHYLLQNLCWAANLLFTVISKIENGKIWEKTCTAIDKCDSMSETYRGARWPLHFEDTLCFNTQFKLFSFGWCFMSPLAEQINDIRTFIPTAFNNLSPFHFTSWNKRGFIDLPTANARSHMPQCYKCLMDCH